MARLTSESEGCTRDFKSWKRKLRQDLSNDNDEMKIEKVANLWTSMAAFKFWAHDF